MPAGRLTTARRADGGLELLTTLGDLEAVAGEWRALAEARGNAFVTPEWCFAWFRHYGVQARPLVPVVRDSGGRLRGLLPLTAPTSGRVRTVRFAGANLGDRFHPVAEEADERLVAAAAAPALAHARPSWAILVLDNVDERAGWVDALVAGAPRRLAALSEGAKVLPYVHLGGRGYDEYLATRKGHFRANLRRRLRQLQERHDVRFRQTASADELGADMEAFFDLHTRRWDARGGSSALSDRARAFHLDFAAAALAAGWLRLWSLEVDGRTVASWYGWRLGTRYAYYLGGFDTAWSRYGVGVLLVARTIEAACEEGCDEYDMLLGDEPWKESFETGRRRVTTTLVTGAAHPARLLTTAEAALRRAARRLPPDARERVAGVAGALLERLPTGRVR